MGDDWDNGRFRVRNEVTFMFNIFMIVMSAIMIGGYVATYAIENIVSKKTAKMIDVVYFSSLAGFIVFCLCRMSV